MKSKILLMGTFAGVIAFTAPAAHALDLGVGSNTHVGVGGIGVGARTDTGIDASGGIMARSNTRTSAEARDDSPRDRNYDRTRVYEESDARFHAGGGSNINADTSAGADDNADVRAQIRNRDDVTVSDTTSANTSARINANAAANTNRGLFGISHGLNSRTTLNAND